MTDGALTALVNVGPENPREFQEVVSTTEKLRPLAEATGGTVRRIGAAHGSDVSLPRIVAMHDSPVYGGSDYAAIKRTDSAQVTGIGIAPLAIGFLGLLFLLASTVVDLALRGTQPRRAGLTDTKHAGHQHIEQERCDSGQNRREEPGENDLHQGAPI